MDGASDIPFERIKITAHDNLNIFELFPHVQFVDYTKILDRVLSPNKPANLHLTLSRSEINWQDCETALTNGHNVAVVFAESASRQARGDWRYCWAIAQGTQSEERPIRFCCAGPLGIERGNGGMIAAFRFVWGATCYVSGLLLIYIILHVIGGM
jgi:hypothetical protein